MAQSGQNMNLAIIAYDVKSFVGLSVEKDIFVSTITFSEYIHLFYLFNSIVWK